MVKNSKKLLSLLLAICMLCSIFTTAIPTVSAEDSQTTPTVDIVSFFRGPQEHLRSSELLEARVTGYDGNVQDLVYEWVNELGTYLYVYNSHNMYYIDMTDGEIEVRPKDKNLAALPSMTDRTHDTSYKEKGFRWASIYGSNIAGDGSTVQNYVAFDGKITVKVYTPDGKTLLCSDTHEGNVTRSGSWWRPTYSYSGILSHDLDDDMDNVTIGIFEGDTRNVKDLLGESAIVHITCVESSVSNGEIVGGDDNEHITLTYEDGEYYITGKKAGTSTAITGDAQVDLTIAKGNCKFHYETSGNATTTVFVFKKPTTDTTAYTLTLTDNIDKRCDYFIDGKQGVEQTDGTILFEGLTPNTNYTVEVRGKYTDNDGGTRYAYTYVYDTTLPVYTGTVETYLTKYGQDSVLTDVEDMYGKKAKVALKAKDSDEYIVLNRTAEGTYSASLEPGIYFVYMTKDGVNYIGNNQELTIASDSRTRHMLFYAVEYDTAGGTPAIDTEYYLNQELVNVTSTVPAKDDFAFVNWADQSGAEHNSRAVLTYNIMQPYKLTAQYEDAADVYVNIKIKHTDRHGGINNDQNIHNIFFTVDQRATNSTEDFTEIYSDTLKWDGEEIFQHNNFEANYLTMPEYSTVYAAKENAPVLTNVPADREYTITTTKSGYYIETVTQETDENGDIILYATLVYEPHEFDLKFNVVLDDNAKALPAELKPVAANVKILAWHDSPHDSDETPHWHTFSRQTNTYERIAIDPVTGEGSGTYAVWTETTDGLKDYTYRIQVVSYELPDGTIMPAYNVNNENIKYTTDDERYTAEIEVKGGKDPETNDENTLTGAYYNETTKAQEGTITAVISIEVFDVIFDPNGGTLNGTANNTVLKDQLAVPDTKLYVPVRDGGYVFEGWYLADEKGNITGDTVTQGDMLESNITLMAKWKDPLTIEGTIAIATTYEHTAGNDTHTHDIYEGDRATEISVVLQRIYPEDNDYFFTVYTLTIPVEYAEDATEGIGTYKFENVPDDGYAYRINVLSPNYSGVFQNEPESVTASTDYDSYDTISYTAVYDGDNVLDVATVNAYLHFDPHDFILNYQVDATAIGEGFRPATADMFVVCDDGKSGSTPQNWPVISQMIYDDGEVKEGQIMNLSSAGIGNDSYPVWRYKTDGVSLYDYSILLDKYDGTKFVAADAPFMIHYNGSARYSAVTDAQTQLLVARLTPRSYVVTFDLDFTESENDYVTNMDNYRVIKDGTASYQTTHIWSYYTDISNIEPVREGYKFLGWYDTDGNLVEGIDASVHKNVTVKAKWEKAYKVTFHANNNDIAEDVFRTYYQEGIETEDTSIMYLNSDNTITSFYDIPEFDYATHNKYIFKGWYLDKDNNNDSRPIKWTDTYTTDTDIYAHWIVTDTVAKEDDGKNTGSDTYAGYDLSGVQIRTATTDDKLHGGTAAPGLRYITVLSENVYTQINNICDANKNGAEYGFVVANSGKVTSFANGDSNYQLQYKGENVNGVNTSSDFSYVQNAKCSGYVDHYDGEAYRLYTAVVNYENMDDAAKAQAQATDLTARSYMRYTDANGLLRTYYNNYTGSAKHCGGCSVSYNEAVELVNNATSKAE